MPVTDIISCWICQKGKSSAARQFSTNSCGRVSSKIKIMEHSWNILAILILFICLSTPCNSSIDPCSSSKPGSDISVIHIFGKCSPFDPPKRASSWVNTVLNMATSDPERVSYLSSLVAQKPTSAPIAPGQVINTGNYVVRVKIGTPGQLMFMVLDTSNDAAWIPCSGCTGCSTTVFTPNTSSTYGSLDCSVPECTQVSGVSCPTGGSGSCLFNRTYGGDSSFLATLSSDTLFQVILFLGFAQTRTLGSTKNIKTTPLLKNPHRPSLYYVNLTGVSVGRVNVPIAPELLAFDPNTGAGTIIDSGTVITRFVQPVYSAIRDEFRKQVKGPFSSLGAFDTCFAATNEEVAPAITFHLSGLDLKLPTENSLIHSSSGSLACLAMAAAPNNVNSVLNVIANLQQQNLRIMFDTVNSRLGIARELSNLTYKKSKVYSTQLCCDHTRSMIHMVDQVPQVCK
ncbi:hypothetical protein DH2020_044685 [Rehmannia glutinosa]|uniref:Peptidase A1 domain-containing protein n=1 Tax=Rehmannia glutinosa TaxID=99300 RepID=A0ABR0UGX6_REHGL